MATHGQRAVAAAALLVETFPGALLPDLRAASDVAAGAAALTDLLRALTDLVTRGAMPDPVRRWALGVPDQVLEPPVKRWTA